MKVTDELRVCRHPATIIKEIYNLFKKYKCLSKTELYTELKLHPNISNKYLKLLEDLGIIYSQKRDSGKVYYYLKEVNQNE